MSNLTNDKVNSILECGVENPITHTKGYTESQIFDALRLCELDPETKSRMSSFLNGTSQFVFNMITIEDFEHTPAALLANTPDDWQLGYNAMVEIFQLKHDCIQQKDLE